MIAGGHTVKDIRLAPITETQRCRCFVCAIPEAIVLPSASARTAPSARTPATQARTRFGEAARATSAAPTYFPVISVQGQTYFDGGLECNNLAVEVIKEARAEFPTPVSTTPWSAVGLGGKSCWTRMAIYITLSLASCSARPTPRLGIRKCSKMTLSKMWGRFTFGSRGFGARGGRSCGCREVGRYREVGISVSRFRPGKKLIESCAARLAAK
jgi:hypothetical protein